MSEPPSLQHNRSGDSECEGKRGQMDSEARALSPSLPNPNNSSTFLNI